MRKAKVIQMELPRNRRILAVSDIHGDPRRFRGALRRAGFCREDILFVVGDFLEKGTRNLETLRLLMELSRDYTVHTLCGNCDDLVVGFVDGREELTAAFFDFYLGIWGERCTLTEMGREAGLTRAEMEDYPYFAAVLRERFQPELDFLRGLPTIIETQNLVFVHGGVPSTAHMEGLDAWRCMKNDDFLSQDTHLDKWCVVGHWPVMLYRAKIPSAEPIVSREKRIVSIDGGCSLKPDGQVNVLVVPEAMSQDFSWVSFDGLPTVVALDAQAPSAESVNIRWGRNQVEVLERGAEFSRCRHRESGRVLDVLTDYLFERDGAVRCEDSTDYRLDVRPGDRLALIRRTGRGILAKKDGETGWYLGRFSEQEGGAPGS